MLSQIYIVSFKNTFSSTQYSLTWDAQMGSFKVTGVLSQQHLSQMNFECLSKFCAEINKILKACHRLSEHIYSDIYCPQFIPKKPLLSCLCHSGKIFLK